MRDLAGNILTKAHVAAIRRDVDNFFLSCQKIEKLHNISTKLLQIIIEHEDLKGI